VISKLLAYIAFIYSFISGFLIIEYGMEIQDNKIVEAVFFILLSYGGLLSILKNRIDLAYFIAGLLTFISLIGLMSIGTMIAPIAILLLLSIILKHLKL